jgi:hypothetical protein
MEIFYNPAKNFCGKPNNLTLYFGDKEVTVKAGFNEVDDSITDHPDYAKLVEVGAFTGKTEPTPPPKPSSRKKATEPTIKLEG